MNRCRSALTMFWVASPYNIYNKGVDVPLEAVLAPVWVFNVLGSVLTQYEQENKDHQVMHYRTDKLEEFVKWFTQQAEYREELKQPRTLTYWFEPSGNKMQKGELVEFREKLIKNGGIETIAKDGEPFKPRATVEGFVNRGRRTVIADGFAVSKLMGVFDDVPKCLKVRVDITDNKGNTSSVMLYNYK